MGSRPKRRQHTVPRTLLRGFADANGCLAMRRRDGTDGLISIRRASVRRDFYSFLGDDGGRVDDVEDWLDEHVESPVSPVLDRLRSGEQPSGSDSPVLAAFAASGLLRTATVRSYLEQLDGDLAPLMLVHKVLTRSGTDPTTLPPESMDRLHAAASRVWSERDKEPDEARSMLRTVLRHFDELASDLSSWAWSLHTADRPCLITADASVATFAPVGQGWLGILPQGSPVFIPISARRLLVGEKFAQGSGTLTADLTRLVNGRLAQEAFDAVFADPSMTWPAEAHMSSQRPTLPIPTVTWSRSDLESSPTFPSIYRAVASESVRVLLKSLGAKDTVE